MQVQMACGMWQVARVTWQVVGTPEWVGNLTRKNNLVYEAIKRVLPHARPFQYDRGGCGRCQPQWATAPPGSNTDPWNRGIGYCADGFRYVNTVSGFPLFVACALPLRVVPLPRCVAQVSGHARASDRGVPRRSTRCSPTSWATCMGCRSTPWRSRATCAHR